MVLAFFGSYWVGFLLEIVFGLFWGSSVGQKKDFVEKLKMGFRVLDWKRKYVRVMGLVEMK